MNQQRTQTSGLFGDDPRRDAVHAHDQIDLGLGFVDGGVAGRIDDDVRPGGAQRGANRTGIAEVHVAASGSDHVSQRGERALQLPSHLAGLAGQQEGRHRCSRSIVRGYCEQRRLRSRHIMELSCGMSTAGTSGAKRGEVM
ncbi:hypothetical protein D3C83_26810 [compost metagenome]